ncbi:MAG TPA: tetratricopeptide repeat protein, partial [Gemmataceae bacterium]
RAEKPMTFAELQAAFKKKPDDADVMARLAGEYIRRNKLAEAKKLAEAALKQEKGHPLASIALARLLIRDKDAAGALKLLEESAKENPDDPRLLLALGKLYIDKKELAKAAEMYERGRKTAPLDGDWLVDLVRIYTSLKRDAELVAVLREVVGRDPDDLPARVKLARLLLKEKPTEAEHFARDALYIDVMSEPARGLLLDALRAQKKDAEADRIAKRFGSQD